jgi:hypothetical protein
VCHIAIAGLPPSRGETLGLAYEALEALEALR